MYGHNTEIRNQRRTNVHAHLPIVFDWRDVFIKCGQKFAHIEKNGLGKWLNANLNGLFVIAIWRIGTLFMHTVLMYCMISIVLDVIKLTKQNQACISEPARWGKIRGNYYPL